MGVRPNLSHLIGFNVSDVPSAKEWMKNFKKKYEEKEFPSFARDIFYQVDDDKEFVDEFLSNVVEGKETSEIIYSFENNENSIFGMLPIFHLEESNLYGHDLIYAAVESGLIGEKQAIKIPYKDYSSLVSSKSEIKKEVKNIQLRNALLNYNGKWARDYPNHPLDWYDDDLEFAYLFFNQLGLSIERKNIDRYVVFEWC